MQKHAAVLANLSDFSQGLNNANLIVGEHHADKSGLFPYCRSYGRWIDPAELVYVQDRYVEPLSFQLLNRVQQRVMLNGSSDDVIATVSHRGGYTLYRRIVRFRSARRKTHFAGAAIQNIGNPLTRLCHRISRLLRQLVDDELVSVAGQAVTVHDLKALTGYVQL